MGIKDKVLNGKGLAELVKKIKEGITGNVVANPTIPEGVTPTALSDLKIGNDYFSAGGSEQHLYWHSVEGRFQILGGTFSGGYVYFGVIVLSDSNTPYTDTSFKTLLLSDNNARYLTVYGSVEVSGTDIYLPFYLQKHSQNPQRFGCIAHKSPGGTPIELAGETIAAFSDHITQIF